ncbi:winged helix family transcriptional regulator [bacterium]|nr:MAG: winged helix family transcriptional regulator [bacterium]
MFRYLYKHSNKIVTSEELLHKVLNHPEGIGNPEVVRTHVKNIRKKIEVSREKPSILIHIPKKGYYLNIDNINID